MSDKYTLLTWISFPLKRPSVLAKWISEIKRKNFKPTKYSYLCSKHFTNDDYQIRPGSLVKWLKDEAIPSVFENFPQHLKKKKVVRRLLQRHPLVNLIILFHIILIIHKFQTFTLPIFNYLYEIYIVI